VNGGAERLERSALLFKGKQKEENYTLEGEGPCDFKRRVFIRRIPY